MLSVTEAIFNTCAPIMIGSPTSPGVKFPVAAENAVDPFVATPSLPEPSWTPIPFAGSPL